MCAGYCGYVFDLLKENDLTFILPGGKVKTLKKCDVDDEMVREALEPMVEWIVFLHRGVRSECPSFELLQSFGVFNMSGYGQDLLTRDTEGQPFSATDELLASDTTEYMLCLERLANLAESDDKGELRRQIEDIGLYARRLHHVQGLLSRAAWGLAIQQRIAIAAKNKKIKNAYLLVRKVITYFIAWDWSTQALENSIGIVKRIFDAHRKSSSLDLVRDELEIVFSDPSCDHQMACDARRIWSEVYSCVRTISTTRADVGVKHDIDDGSAASFKKRRHDKIKAIVKAKVAVQLNPHAVPEGGWSSEVVANEAKFQDDKFKRKLLEEAASSRPTLTKAEKENIPAAELATFRKKTLEAQRQYINAKLKTRAKITGPQKPILDGLNVFVDGDVDLSSAEIAKYARKMKLLVSEDRNLSFAFVVNDAANPGQRIAWRAMMIGGCILSKEAFTRNCASGALFTYHAVNAVKKTWFLSDKFIAEHGAIAKIIEDGANMYSSKIKLLQGGSCPWLKTKSGSSAANANRYLAMITKSERGEFKNVRHFTCGAGLSEMMKLDPARTFSGQYGRRRFHS